MYLVKLCDLYVKNDRTFKKSLILVYAKMRKNGQNSNFLKHQITNLKHDQNIFCQIGTVRGYNDSPKYIFVLFVLGL